MGFVVTLLLFAAFLTLSEILGPKPKVENARPAGLGDFQFPTSTEERVIPLVWGTNRIDGPNVIWYGDLRQIPITQKVKTGLFSSKRVTSGYEYYIGIQMALCRGAGDAASAEQAELLRVFVDDTVVFSGTQGEGSITIDQPDLFGGQDLGQGGISGTLSVRVGTEDQILPTYLQPYQQAPSTASPNYRGTFFVTWEGGYIGNTTSVAPWGFEVRRIPNGLSLADPTVNSGNDANPMNVIYEILTNDEWGFGFPSGDINTTVFATAAETLRLEGNGISFVLDREIQISELLQEIERQIDGKVYIDRSTGLWTIKLARDDYDINTVPQITNPIEIRDFTRGAWEDTSNFIQVQFKHRGREYQGTYAPAVDHGNIFIQGGNIKKSILSFPMVKDPTLANAIAWRELRSLSFPLARVKMVVDRSFYNLNPADTIAWTDSTLGITQLPMRVTKIDLGELQSNRITLDLVQDVFTFETPSFADPSSGSWTPPSTTLVAIPADESVVIEAPRAFLTRDTNTVDPDIQKVWAGGRYQSDGAASINILDDSNTSYEVGGEVFGFLLIGKLTSDLGNANNTNQILTNTLTITPDPDTQAAILAALVDASSSDIGNDLANLILVGDELMAFETASANVSDIDLDNVYRGMCDTAQASHSADDPVYLISVAGNLTDRSYTSGSVNIKLQTVSTTDTLSSGSAPTIAQTLANRSSRPYLPASFTLNTAKWPSSVSLDSTQPGSGLDGVGIRTALRRRDFRSTNEVEALENDAATLFPDFPAANTTLYMIEVIEDPDGSPTSLFTTDPDSAINQDITRTKIIRENGGTVPSRIEFRVESRHTYNTVVFDSLDTLDFAFDVTSAFSALAELGVLDTNVTSNSFIASDTGTYSVAIGTAFSSGNVEGRINAGSWTTVISTGLTSGTLAGVTAGDTLEFRHTSGDSSAETAILVTAPSSGDEAQGVFIT